VRGRVALRGDVIVSEVLAVGDVVAGDGEGLDRGQLGVRVFGSRALKGHVTHPDARLRSVK
jgi:hypothetical protein